MEKDRKMNQDEPKNAADSKAAKKDKPKKSMKREIFEWIMVFVVAGAMAFVIRSLIFEPVRVDGESMMNTLQDKEFMITTKFDYILGDPERFDIVICNYPNTEDGMYRVKRIIGLPGETIELRNGDLYVNGEYVEQNFEMTANSTNYGPFNVPSGHYFVMGDNRNNSKDSRNPLVGALDRKMIKGHVRCVVFPFTKIRLMKY